MLSADLDRFPALLDAARRAGLETLLGLDDRPVTGVETASPAHALPAEGTGGEGALERFAGDWAPGFSASPGPRYLGFVTGGATPAAVAGDWLVSAFDQNAMVHGGSAAAALERETVGHLRELLGLGPEHQGSFVTGATMSTTVGLALGREWLGERQGVSVARDGLAALDGPVTVLSGAPHSSVFKALSMLGLGRGTLRTLPLLPGREAVDPAALEAALAELNGRPALVVANAGTVNTGDFDDLRAILALRERYPFWLHADAAFGGFAALAPTHAHLVDGLGAADSVCVDLHKWLNVPYDAAVQFTRHRELQVRVFQNGAAYLDAPEAAGDIDFAHLSPENSRRLRALPAWFSLTAYGREGHREIVERNLRCARLLGDRVTALPGLRLLAPVHLNIVCFTLDTGDGGPPGAERVHALARAVADSGEAYLTPTVHAGVPALRAAFSNWRTREEDVERVAAALRQALAG
nr:pyridoxal-dependent decarboxylase [Streptomyces boncukensis]